MTHQTETLTSKLETLFDFRSVNLTTGEQTPKSSRSYAVNHARGLLRKGYQACVEWKINGVWVVDEMAMEQLERRINKPYEERRKKPENKARSYLTLLRYEAQNLARKEFYTHAEINTFKETVTHTLLELERRVNCD